MSVNILSIQVVQISFPWMIYTGPKRLHSYVFMWRGVLGGSRIFTFWKEWSPLVLCLS